MCTTFSLFLALSLSPASRRTHALCHLSASAHYHTQNESIRICTHTIASHHYSTTNIALRRPNDDDDDDTDADANDNDDDDHDDHDDHTDDAAAAAAAADVEAAVDGPRKSTGGGDDAPRAHEKSVLQAKLTKLAIQIGYAGWYRSFPC